MAPDEFGERLDRLEARLPEAPGSVQDEFEALLDDLEAELHAEVQAATTLARNEDFPGAAAHLTRTAIVLQRAGLFSLDVREAIRRRR